MKSKEILPVELRNDPAKTKWIDIKIGDNTIIKNESYIDITLYVKAIKALEAAEDEILTLRKLLKTDD